MNKFFSPAVLCMCIGFAVNAGAQDPSQPPRNPQQQQQSATQQVTVTGCLAKGSGASEYVVTEQSTNERLSFAGNAQLDKYVNQLVKMTGNVTTRDSGEKVFQPDTISTVAPNCQGTAK